jgi:2-polyprenyl-3-methyl-5-hydroxy-6-metoxy-1,4-benzoquinol methylase
MVALLQRIETTLGPVARGRALDFGCGVGRLALPLVRDAGFARVVGVDI